MGTVRIIQTIMGYIVPFALVVAGLFLLEIIAELGAGILSYVVNQIFPGAGFDTTPDFPGPLNMLNFAIGAFPSFWDIGTVLFWGAIEETTFIGYVLLTIVAIIFDIAVIHTARERLKDISDTASSKSSLRTGLTIPKIE